MKQQAKKWLKFSLRWGVAVVGVWLVVRTIAFRDHVQFLSPATGSLVDATVIGPSPEGGLIVHVPGTARDQVVRLADLWARPDRSKIGVISPGGAVVHEKLLAVHPKDPANPRAGPDRFLVEDPATRALAQIEPSRVARLGDYLRDYIPYPVVEIGLDRMVLQANRLYIAIALAVIPIALFITTWRWRLLLEAVGIHIGVAQTFAINMVGLFYNTFMPGSTGGDLVKAYYASKHTPHRTWAIISVLMDRGLGLLALVMLGGTMASLQWQIPACRKVAIVSWSVLGAAAVGMLVFYTPALRRLTGFDYLLTRLPGQRLLHTAVKGLEMYGHDHPTKTLLALLICFPVHVTTIVSAMLAGHAFGISLPPMYYWVIVPVIALVGAIPISPQGAGVMEGFAILLTRSQGVTTSQAVALTLSIRLVQIFWNLVAGVFVLRGGYHAPTETEQHELEADDPEVIEATPVLPVQV